MHVVDDALIVRAAHETLERRERTGREHVEVGELTGGQLDGLERVEIGRPLARAIDERAAVRRDQAIGRRNRHARTPAGMWPSSSSFAMTWAAASSGSVDSVSTTISGLGRRLVRVVHAREALDLAGERLRVEAVHVTPCALVDGSADEHLDERAELLDHRAGLPPRLLVRRDRGRNYRAALPRDPRGDPADALDVRVAVLLREPEALREVRAHGVAVEVLDHEPTAVELRPDEVRDRRLPGAGEAGEPEREAAASRALGLGVVVRVDVLRHVVLSAVLVMSS